MIFDAISGEMQEGTHYISGPSNVWLWAGGLEVVLAAPSPVSMEFALGGTRLHWALGSDRTQYQLGATRLHWETEET